MVAVAILKIVGIWLLILLIKGLQVAFLEVVWNKLEYSRYVE